MYLTTIDTAAARSSRIVATVSSRIAAARNSRSYLDVLGEVKIYFWLF
jgi:hypothetical protein